VALPDLVLGSDDSDYFMSHNEYQLETGQAYQLKIISNGQKEYAFQAPEFRHFHLLAQGRGRWRGGQGRHPHRTGVRGRRRGGNLLPPVKPGKFCFYAKGLEGKGMLGHFVVK
jgi:hypothetical protein